MRFAQWCDSERTVDGRKRLWKLSEQPEGRAVIKDSLSMTLRSYYDDTERIAQDILDLGFPGAATLLAERLPRTATARSGDLGEILATELIEEETEFTVPIRRLRYKDGREMALRGDDFLGIYMDEAQQLHILKGESKSRANLSKTTITEARESLSRDGGRPTATSLLFIADRLMEYQDDRATLGRAIRNEVAARAIPPARIGHALFTMSGNSAPQALAADLQAADDMRTHTVIHLHIKDHQAFIAAAYAGALALGDD